MKAITFRGTESVALESVPDPKIEASTDVIVKGPLSADASQPDVGGGGLEDHRCESEIIAVA